MVKYQITMSDLIDRTKKRIKELEESRVVSEGFGNRLIVKIIDDTLDLNKRLYIMLKGGQRG